MSPESNGNLWSSQKKRMRIFQNWKIQGKEWVIFGFEKNLSNVKAQRKKKKRKCWKIFNFLEMLICLCKQTNNKKRETWRFKKNISGESRNIQCKIKLSPLLVPFLSNSFASLHRWVSDENHRSFSLEKILKESIQVLSPTKGPPAL